MMRRASCAAEIMRDIYWELLRRIEAARFDVFTEVIRVPRPAQARHRASRPGGGCATVRHVPLTADRGRRRHWRRLCRPERGRPARDAGVDVTVVEEAPRLGGRATAFTDRETGERVDNGQHVLFGCYRETYAFLRSLGTAELAPLQTRLRLDDGGADGRRADAALSAPGRRRGISLAACCDGRRSRWRDRLSALGLGRVICACGETARRRCRARVPSGADGRGLAGAHRQSTALCEWLWHPLAIAALNQSPDVAAAAPFVRVLGELFGPHRDDSAVGLPAVPLDELYADAGDAAFIEARAARSSRNAARVVVDERGRIAARASRRDDDRGDGGRQHRAVACARPHLGRSRAAGAGRSDCRPRRACGSSPIVTVNLWFDGPVTDEPFVGLVGRADALGVRQERALRRTRGASVGRGERRRRARRARERTRLRTRRSSSRPARPCRVEQPRRSLRSVVVREHRATFSLAPGGPRGPATRDAFAGFFLAGDWTDTGCPARSKAPS